MSAPSTDSRRRVKLYVSNASRQWDDKGTGHVTSCYHEPLDGMSLLVRNELDGSLLLESKIQLDTQYQKQQGTLIVWTESDNYDLALSFLEPEGCNEIWEKICEVQGRNPSDQDNEEEQEEVRIQLVDCDYDKLELILEQIADCSQTTKRKDVLASEYIEGEYIDKLLKLFKGAEEKADLAALHKLYEIFKQLFLYDRPTLTEVMTGESLILDIIGVFEYEPPSTTHQQEQEQAQQELNDSDPIATTTPPPSPPSEQQQQQEQEQVEEPKSDDIQTQTASSSTPPHQNSSSSTPPTLSSESASSSASSSTPAHHQPSAPPKKEHREFLQNGTTFKEVIPFGNKKLVDKIHQTYRVQYLQTSVLPPSSFLEDNVYSSLTNILFFNKVEIVTMIQEDVEFLQNLFNQIISNETGLDRKRELVQFLREYCMFSQTIQPKQRESFFKTLASLKILSAVEVALSSNDQVIKSAAIDIFTYLVEYSPHMTREHAVQQREGLINPPNSNAQTANILKLVIEHITTDQDPELGTATQLACIVRLLLDPENMPGDTNGKHLFLDFFYYSCIQSLVEPIKNSTTSGSDIEPSANDRKTAQLLSIMLELLTFFTEHHYNQLRNYLVSSDLLKRITSLIKSRHKFLVLSVVRFFRRLVATKDSIYNELIINEGLFTPIIQALKNNNGRYNLVDSAILEMFEFIQNEDMIPLIDHVITEYGTILDTFDYVNTFKQMRLKKDAIHNAMMKDSTRANIENPQMYFSGHSRPENMWFDSIEADVDDVNDVGDLDPDSDKNLDPDSGDASVDSDSDGLNIPELEFTMNGTKNEEGEDDEDEVEDEEVEDDYRIGEEDCESELEPQFKKKKTK